MRTRRALLTSIAVLILLEGMFVLASGCKAPVGVNGPVSPGIPSTPTPTITPTFTATPYQTPYYSLPVPGGIHWWKARIIATDCDPATDRCGNAVGFIYLAVNGVPDATAGVTLTTPHGDLPLTLIGGCEDSYSETYFTCYRNDFPTGWGVRKGDVFTLTTNTSIGVASSSVTAPGGPVSMSPDCRYVYWSGEGNNDTMDAYSRCASRDWYLDTSWSTSDIASPYDLYANLDHGDSCGYDVWLALQNRNWDVLGATSVTGFHVRCDYFYLHCSEP